MKILRCEQKSPEWWAARRGVPTASEFSRIITPKTGKLSASAYDYICELIADIHAPTWPPEEGFISRAMQEGINREPESRRWYEMERMVSVNQVGFITTDDGRFGASPDGIVNNLEPTSLSLGRSTVLVPTAVGGLELKNPTLKTHVKWLLDGGLPDEHKVQVHGGLVVSGLPWWDFCSYSPGLAPLLLRVEPDAYTEKLRLALDEFWGRFQEVLAKFKE